MDFKIPGILLVFTFFSISGCSQATAPISATQEFKTSTQFLVPSNTKAITAKPTITSTATSTQTAGPPPDLELKSTIVYSESNNSVGGAYFIFGKIRNNLDEMMVLYHGDTIFNFTFEVWQFDSGDFSRYVHAKYIEEVGLKYESYNWAMNCILYPGEEGVFVFHTSSNRAEYVYWDNIDEYNGPLGLWYTYESNYRTKPDLPNNLHPKTENLIFSIEGEKILFEYDVIDVPVLQKKINTARLHSWLILYDNEGNILNLLMKNLGEIPGLIPGKNFHVSGYTSTDTTIVSSVKIFKPAMRLSQEAINRVSRIEVFTEFEEFTTCTTYDD